MLQTAARPRLTPAQEDHLKALYHLRGHQRQVPTGELAHRLGVSASAVTEMVTRLSALQLVAHDRFKGQGLTPEGEKVALELVRHHRLIEMFLVQVLGYGWDEVHEEAERLEHVISERMEERIFELLGRPELDPHGHAIPSRDGELAVTSDRTLNGCAAGDRVIISGVSDDDPARLRALRDRGLVPGARLEVLQTGEFEGPIEATLDGQRVTVPLGLARGIFVREDVTDGG